MTAAVKIGILGLSAHALRYVRHIDRDVPGLELVAACRRTPADADRAALAGRPVYASARELLADPRVEAVIVCTPPTTHLELTRAAIAAGRPVLVEKPFAATEDDCRDLIDRAARAGVGLMVAQTMRYEPAFRALLDALRGERELALRVVHMSDRWRSVSEPHLALPSPLDVGMLLELGVHFFDLFRLALGGGRWRVLAAVPDGEAPELEFTVRIATPRGSAVLDVARRAPAVHEVLFARTPARVIELHRVDHRMFERTGREVRPLPLPPPGPTLPLILRDFERLLRGAPPAVTGADGLAAVRVARAAREAARTGAAVDVELPDPAG